MKARWTDAVAWAAKAAKIRPLKKALFRFSWHEAHRRRDPDNIIAGTKFVLDGLVKVGVLENDGWSQVLLMEHAFYVRPESLGVEVTLYEGERA